MDADVHSAQRSLTYFTDNRYRCTKFDFRLTQEQCAENLNEWVSMAKQLHPSVTSPSTMQSVGCGGVKHVSTGL